MSGLRGIPYTPGVPEADQGIDYLRVTPAGHLRPLRGSELPAADGLRRAMVALETDTAAGLFELAAHEASGGLPPQLSYWRDFAARYLTARCHTPTGTSRLEPLPPVAPDEAMSLLLAAPPMPGAEYLSTETLARLWGWLDQWVRARAEEAGSLEALLKARAPLWRQVGRVCFHLAENRKDPDYPFAFLATYAPSLGTGSRVRYQPLSRALEEFAGSRNRAALLHLLTPVERAAEKSALVRELVESNDIYHPLAWVPEEAYRFLQDVPLLEDSGVLVRVPDWWSKRRRPQVAVRIGSEQRTALGADALLDFQVEVALGDRPLTASELQKLLAGSDGLVLLKGQWVEVDRGKLEEALAHWRKVEEQAAAGGLSFVEGMRLLAGAPADLTAGGEPEARDWSFVDAGPWLRELLASLRSPGSIDAALPQRELRTSLRPYQEAGVRWLWLLTRLGLGACLADDMGLGKTIEMLALLLMMRRSPAGPSLLVMPASLLANWKAEIERFAPSLRAIYEHPAFRGEEGAARGPEAAPDVSAADLVITSYGMLARTAWLESVDWRLVVLDEAQAIKNPGTRQTRAVKRLKAKARVALTGTPVENRLTDLWSIFDFLCPGLLGSASRFKEFSKSLEKLDGERYAPLRNLVRPYLLRRLKTDRSVIADLPDKSELRAFCGLSRLQAALYQKTVQELASELAGVDGIKRRGVVLAAITRLKQICNHPAQFRGDGRWDPDDSGKFIRLRELCEEIAARQDRALVFTQYREMTEPLAAFLSGVFGSPGLVLHGGTPVAQRRRLVESFQSEDGPPFFVLSLKAGGTGLNLTAASHVIHFDRWWNPAVENQATDRAFRIGQRKNVLVHPFVCQGTIEERIDALIEEKTDMAKDLLEGGGEALLTEMDDERLLATMRLDLDRALVGA